MRSVLPLCLLGHVEVAINVCGMDFAYINESVPAQPSYLSR